MVKKGKKRGYILKRGIFKGVKFFYNAIVKSITLMVLVTMASLLALTIYEYLVVSDYFKIKDIILEGLNEKDQKRLNSFLDTQSNRSLISIDIEGLKKLLSEDPWIYDIHIKRQFPHTLIIQAKRMKPVGILFLKEPYYLTDIGRLIRDVSFSKGRDYPIISGISLEDRDLREKIEGLLMLLRALNRSYELTAEKGISEIHMEDNETAILYPINIPFPIVLDIGEIQKDIRDLVTLITYLKENGTLEAVQSIRMDYGDKAVVAFKDKIF